MIADFARAMGKFAKTDKIDATILAEFGSRIGSKLTTPASEELRALEAVTNRRAQILEMITIRRVLGVHSPNQICKLCAAIFRHTLARTDQNEFNCPTHK